MCRRALDVIEPIFIKICVEEQSMLGTEEKVLKFLGIIAEEEMRTEVKHILDQYPTSFTKWNAFIEFFRNKIQSVGIFITFYNYYFINTLLEIFLL